MSFDLEPEKRLVESESSTEGREFRIKTRDVFDKNLTTKPKAMKMNVYDKRRWICTNYLSSSSSA
ncbi:hypothetical protein F8388_019626 [Cannabis sativa]|uniref:Uncharacterized protein n=1 Tax=Cannabis sativa TaxID=3483 RepID=A0A7J6DZI0_CANSA|nr:hypothetical protein F8388_019626 [Cannabis sativa]KAF4351567.1 hypothetical protein G4B88_000605 [Cannabis sativa]